VVFDNKVFVSATYRTGSALVEIQKDFTHKVVWTARDIGLHFNTAIHQDGHLYAFDGRNEPDASLVCVNAATGEVVWRETLEWEETIGGRQSAMGPYRGSLLAVDGQFLCLGEMGHLLWLDLSPKGVREIGRTWLFAARESWTLPVLSRGLLYVSQNTRDVLNRVEPRLACYDLRA
jgi:outer membrane protein assembly factor BamB